MSVALGSGLDVPVIVKEESQMVADGIFDAVKEDLKQIDGAFLYIGHTCLQRCRTFFFQRAEQVGVAFKDVEMGVHGLGGVGVMVAQAHVGYRLPVMGGGLDIAVFTRSREWVSMASKSSVARRSDSSSPQAR